MPSNVLPAIFDAERRNTSARRSPRLPFVQRWLSSSTTKVARWPNRVAALAVTASSRPEPCPSSNEILVSPTSSETPARSESIAIAWQARKTFPAWSSLTAATWTHAVVGATAIGLPFASNPSQRVGPASSASDDRREKRSSCRNLAPHANNRGDARTRPPHQPETTRTAARSARHSTRTAARQRSIGHLQVLRDPRPHRRTQRRERTNRRPLHPRPLRLRCPEPRLTRVHPPPNPLLRCLTLRHCTPPVPDETGPTFTGVHTHVRAPIAPTMPPRVPLWEASSRSRRVAFRRVRIVECHRTKPEPRLSRWLRPNTATSD